MSVSRFRSNIFAFVDGDDRPSHPFSHTNTSSRFSLTQPRFSIPTQEHRSIFELPNGAGCRSRGNLKAVRSARSSSQLHPTLPTSFSFSPLSAHDVLLLRSFPTTTATGRNSSSLRMVRFFPFVGVRFRRSSRNPSLPRPSPPSLSTSSCFSASLFRFNRIKEFDQNSQSWYFVGELQYPRFPSSEARNETKKKGRAHRPSSLADTQSPNPTPVWTDPRSSSAYPPNPSPSSYSPQPPIDYSNTGGGGGGGGEATSYYGSAPPPPSNQSPYDSTGNGGASSPYPGQPGGPQEGQEEFFTDETRSATSTQDRGFGKVSSPVDSFPSVGVGRR